MSELRWFFRVFPEPILRLGAVVVVYGVLFPPRNTWWVGINELLFAMFFVAMVGKWLFDLLSIDLVADLCAIFILMAVAGVTTYFIWGDAHLGVIFIAIVVILRIAFKG